MKIDSLTLHHISMPLVAPFETSFGRETERECILITLQAEGLTGYGECVASRERGYNYETTGTAWHILKEFIAPLVLGKDVKDALDFQRRVERIRLRAQWGTFKLQLSYSGRRRLLGVMR